MTTEIAIIDQRKLTRLGLERQPFQGDFSLILLYFSTTDGGWWDGAGPGV